MPLPLVVGKTVEGEVAVLVPHIDSEGPDAGQIAKLGSLLEQYGWRNKVPVVVTRAGLDPEDHETKALHGVLDSYHASLVHQIRAGAAAKTTGGGLSAFLGNPWTVREARNPGGTG